MNLKNFREKIPICFNIYPVADQKRNQIENGFSDLNSAPSGLALGTVTFPHISLFRLIW